MTRDASIGTATMSPDGTIVLSLRAEDDSGLVGNATIEYPKTNSQYADILAHLGGLEPGENKLVQPWI